jgi:hypothetical protein
VNRRILPILTTLLVLMTAAHASALGEIFKVDTSGTMYCDGFTSKFRAGNDVDLWIRIDSDTLLTVSLTQTFEPGTTFEMIGESYLLSSKKAAFVGGVLFESGSYAVIQGTATLKSDGTVRKLDATFIQYDLFGDGCFSSGKAKTSGASLN